MNQKKARKTSQSRVVVLRRDSNNMASSWSVSLILRRTRSGTLELVQEVNSYEVSGGTDIEYAADVESPSWLAQFIRDPPGAVAERFDSIDSEQFLAGVVNRTGFVGGLIP